MTKILSFMDYASRSTTSPSITTRLGSVLGWNRLIWDCPEGLIGFHHLHQYALCSLPLVEEKTPFFMMYAVSDPQTCFVLYNGTVDFEDHFFVLKGELLDTVKDLLASKLLPSEEYAFLVYLNPHHKEINLSAPIVFNREEHTMRQVIISDTLMYQKFSTDFI